MARILLGVSGGIAAYKALELARLATRAGHGVRVLMTPTATRFVGAASFEGIVGAPVLMDEFERDPLRGAFPGEKPPDHDPIGHLEVAANADAYLVAPASANTIAKLAAGICDSILTTVFLACAAPRAVAPAMNDRMYEDAATQDNLRLLLERGVRVIEPEAGPLASRGEHGVGRLPAGDRLLAEIEAMLPTSPGAWDGMKVLVTAGGTREPIDAVRYVGNRSSGRMGFALAEEAARRGADVTVVAANVALARLRGRVRPLRPAPDGGGRRGLPAGGAADRQDQEDGRRRGTAAPPGTYRGCALRPRRPPPRRSGRRRLRRRGRRARARPRTRQARAQAARRRRRQRHRRAGHRLRRARERGHHPHRRGGASRAACY